MLMSARGATYVDYTIQAAARVAVAILRFQLDSCEKRTANGREENILTADGHGFTQMRGKLPMDTNGRE
jgi:hypothetical protein